MIFARPPITYPWLFAHHCFIFSRAMERYVPLSIAQHSFGQDFGPLYQEAKEIALEKMQQQQ
jgi:hypothetical protein